MHRCNIAQKQKVDLQFCIEYRNCPCSRYGGMGGKGEDPADITAPQYFVYLMKEMQITPF